MKPAVSGPFSQRRPRAAIVRQVIMIPGGAVGAAEQDALSRATPALACHRVPWQPRSAAQRCLQPAGGDQGRTGVPAAG